MCQDLKFKDSFIEAGAMLIKSLIKELEVILPWVRTVTLMGLVPTNNKSVDFTIFIAMKMCLGVLYAAKCW